MRTTVDLPDEIFRQAKAQAALQGMTFKDLIARFVEQGLRHGFRQAPKTERRRRSELPIARAATGRPLPVFSSAELADADPATRSRTSRRGFPAPPRAGDV